MEGGALFDPGFLGGQFLWWVGQIPDDSTWRENINPGVYPQKDGQTGWGRRYKVRIIGIHDKEQRQKGMGIRIMQYRARIIGASLDISRGEKNGTIITCVLPEDEVTVNHVPPPDVVA